MPIADSNSPLFPIGKDLTIPTDAKPVASTASVQIYIKLAEPVVFLQDFENLNHSDKPPGILRGSLILRILKPTKVKNLTLNFKGYARTEWIEGIPPKKQEFAEINDIINHTWPFYQSSEHHHSHHAHSSTASSSPAASNATSNNSGSNTRTGTPGNEDSPVYKGTGAALYRPLPRSTSERALRTGATQSSTPTNFSPLKNNTVLRSKSKDNLDDFARKRVLSRASSHSTLTNNSFNSSSNSNNGHTLNKTLSPMSFLRRATSSNSAHAFGVNDTPSASHRNGASTPTHPAPTGSFISDILSGNFASPGDSTTHNHAGNSSHQVNSNNQSQQATADFDPVGENGTFQPGDYIYPFEQLIPQSYPETVKAEFGFVEYYLFVSLERHGPFKSNLTGRTPVNIIRTQSDNSVEESEPIIISRDWENALFYDIVIGSKDIVLDAFLPINFRLSPMEKLTLHRIRIYVTETMEYFCKNQKVHRIEPTKKFLLAEHKGPRVPGLPKDANYNKAKNMGNLLLDESSGDLVNKEFQYQLFVPSKFNNHQKIHPDTTYDNIKANHWIKICLRLSRVVGDKRKHYEISIDSPMRVLHKLCSHANTLLPSYESHLIFNKQNFTDSSSQKNRESTNDNELGLYHDSNIFFPKEVLMSPLLSPDVQALDVNTESIYNAPYRVIRHDEFDDSRHKSGNDPSANVFNSPTLKSNIYQPDSIQRELASPQAVPLSPMLSSLSLTDFHQSNPPDFESLEDQLSAATTRSNSPMILPKDPPTYKEATHNDPSGVVASASIPKIKLSHSQESLPINNKNLRIKGLTPFSDTASIDTLSNDGDIAAGFQFSSSPNLTHSLLRSHSPSMISLHTGENVKNTPRLDVSHDNMPSTIRDDRHFFNDISQILGDEAEENENHLKLSRTHESSNGEASARSSFDMSAINFRKDSVTAEPLLSNRNNSQISGIGNFAMPSKESLPLLGSPTDSSVDITALYDRNSAAWHPLQLEGEIPLSPIVSNESHSNMLFKANQRPNDDATNTSHDEMLTRDVNPTDDSSGGLSDTDHRRTSHIGEHEKPITNAAETHKNINAVDSI